MMIKLEFEFFEKSPPLGRDGLFWCSMDLY